MGTVLTVSMIVGALVLAAAVFFAWRVAMPQLAGWALVVGGVCGGAFLWRGRRTMRGRTHLVLSGRRLVVECVSGASHDLALDDVARADVEELAGSDHPMYRARLVLKDGSSIPLDGSSFGAREHYREIVAEMNRFLDRPSD